jgi:hypothetical protein
MVAPRLIPQIPIAAAEITDLEGLGTVERIGRRRLTDVVQVKPRNGEVTQIWVNSGYKRYRKAWLSVHDCAPNMDLDHILPRGLADIIQKYQYLRIFPISSSNNRRAGATNEKETMGHLKAREERAWAQMGNLLMLKPSMLPKLGLKGATAAQIKAALDGGTFEPKEG